MCVSSRSLWKMGLEAWWDAHIPTAAPDNLSFHSGELCEFLLGGDPSALNRQ